MQELVKRIVQETGLSHEMATIAVRITLDFLKKKLAASTALQMDNIFKPRAPSAEVRMYLESLRRG